MAKRTVVRWVDKMSLDAEHHACWVPRIWRHRDAEANIPITITYDDGEPEGRCPCDLPDPNVGMCCGFGDGKIRATCCTCHVTESGRGKDPCLSPFHKPKVATRDRVVEGSVYLHNPIHSFKDAPPNTRMAGPAAKAQLTIHEPVPEPTLYEAVEGAIEGWYAPTPAVKEVIAAFNREKAARDKEGK